MLTAAERLNAARFVRDIYHHERKRLRRHPLPHETVVASYAAARTTLDSYVGDRMAYLGAPREARIVDITAASRSRPSAPLADQAEAALRYLELAGDSPTAKPASIEIDRRIVELMAQSYRRTHDFNDSEIGRRIGLSHTSIRDRRLARSARIMVQLHRDCPEIFNAKLRPVSERTPLEQSPTLALAA